jgi:hypothetical protein
MSAQSFASLFVDIIYFIGAVIAVGIAIRIALNSRRWDSKWRIPASWRPLLVSLWVTISCFFAVGIVFHSIAGLVAVPAIGVVAIYVYFSRSVRQGEE